MDDEEPISPVPIPQRRTKDTTGQAVLNFFNTPVGMAALNGVSEEATATARYAIYALQGILASWVTKRILLDVLDMVMKIYETKNFIQKKP